MSVYPALLAPRAACPVLIAKDPGMEQLIAERFKDPLGVPRASVHVEIKG